MSGLRVTGSQQLDVKESGERRVFGQPALNAGYLRILAPLRIAVGRVQAQGGVEPVGAVQPGSQGYPRRRQLTELAVAGVHHRQGFYLFPLGCPGRLDLKTGRGRRRQVIDVQHAVFGH